MKVLRLKPATINHRLQAVRWVCGWATRRGLLSTDPAGEVRAVRVMARRRPAGLSEAQVHKLFRAAGQGRPTHRLRDYAILQLLLQAGLRVGEVVGLKVDDVTIHQRSGHVRVRLGKGGKEREVPLNASVRRAISVHLATREHPEPSEPLFLSQQGEGLAQRSVQLILSTLSRRAKLERAATPHTLRHTFALNYLHEHPGQLVELANLLGHDSLDTTAMYTQPSAEELAANLESSRFNVFG